MEKERKRKIVDIFVVTVISGIVIFGFIINFVPSVTPLEFSTVKKFSDLYDKPIFLKFNWKSNEQIIVGSPVFFSAELTGLPHSTDDESLKPITLQFVERQIDYFGSEGQTLEEEISKRDRVRFSPDPNDGIFKSNQISVRFIVEEPIDIELCDQNISKCKKIEDIIVPAPRTMEIELHQNRINITIALAAIVFSSILVWGRLRPS